MVTAARAVAKAAVGELKVMVIPVTQQKSTATKNTQAGTKSTASQKASSAGSAASRVLSKSAAASRKSVGASASGQSTAAKPASPQPVEAPVAEIAKPVVAAPAAAPAPKGAPAPAKAPAAAAKPQGKANSQRNGFRTGEFVVYPAHGVGQIVSIEEQEVAGFKLELFVVSFMKDKMTLRVPTSKVTSVGLRKLAETGVMQRALDTLMGRARIKRTMWSRRAQEYEAKINSGDLVAIAEVVRDLYRSDAQPEQSYSERQLYEAALDRMAREIAAVQKLTENESLKLIDTQLQRGPRRGPKADAEGDAAEGETGAEGDIEEAA